MKLLVALLLVLIGNGLGACSNFDRFDLPKNPSTGNPSVSSISDRLRCELAYLVSDQFPYSSAVRVSHLVVGAQLDLSVTDEGTLAPNITYIDGLFSFNIGARIDISRQQNFTGRLYYSLDEIYDQTKGRMPESDHQYPDGRRMPYNCPKVDTYLAGDLGIAKTVEMGILTKGLDLYSTKIGAASGAFGGYVNFIVTRNVNMVGPTYTLRHFKGPGSLGSLEEKNNHKITFAFASAGATGQPPPVKIDDFIDTLIQGQIVNGLANLR